MKKAVFGAFLGFLLMIVPSLAWSAEEGLTDTEIVIGSHQDLSGPIAGWGIQVKTGLEMRAREINEAGGIHGRKIRMVIEDNAYDPKKAIMVTNKIINQDKVFAFIGNMGSPTALATKPIISAKKIPQMFPLTSATGFFQPHDRYSFGGFLPYYDQGRAETKYFVEHKKHKKIGLMYQDDEFGHIVKKGVEDQLATYNMKMTAAESYKRGATEFGSQIAKLKKAMVEVVILGTVLRETVGALREVRKIGWNVDICAGSSAHTQFVIELSKKSGFSPDGLYCGAQTPHIYADSPLPTVRDWWKRHVEWFGKDPDMPTHFGYIAVHYFAIAANKVGKDLTREKLIDALETFRDEPEDIFGGIPITFTATNHQGAHGVLIQQVKGGKFVTVVDRIYYNR